MDRAAYLPLEVITTSLGSLLSQLQADLERRGLSQGLHLSLTTREKEVQLAPRELSSLLALSVAYLRERHKGPLTLRIEETQLAYPLPSVGKRYEKKVSALCWHLTSEADWPGVALLYVRGSTLESSRPCLPSLLFIERIVLAHYGALELTEKSVTFVLPEKLREVRPKEMDRPEMRLGAELREAEDTFPGALAQEATFLEQVKEKMPESVSVIEEALSLIKLYHGAEHRHTGEPFYLHPLTVAQIVLEYSAEEATVLSALLHDTGEDTPLTLSQISVLFGEEVKEIVAGVSSVECLGESFYRVKMTGTEQIRHLLEARDRRIWEVKLADRLHHMRTLEGKPYKSQRRKAKDTLEGYVIQARALGLKAVAEELQELSEAVLSA